MKHFLLSLILVFWAAAPAWSAPSFVPLNRSMSVSGGTLLFAASDSSDSAAVGVSGFCSVRATIAGSDAVSLYAVTASTTAATSGSLLKAFTASTSPANPIYTFTASTQYVKAVATSSSTGGSVLVIECSPLVGTGGGGAVDADGDGRYEVAYLWDADGDGSTKVTCTGAAGVSGAGTPDIACKATGEVIYRDTIDDINCAIHGCGAGQMERDGTLILNGGVVWLGFPCWSPTTTNNTPEHHEVDHSYHNASNDTDVALCPRDADSQVLSSISFEGWGGTLTGEGIDTRELQQGSMSTTLRRDRGTYLVNDMGPWDATKNNNAWFGDTDNSRFVNTGFHNGYSNLNHNTGASAAGNSTSKGWWKVMANVDFTTYVDPATNTVCLQNTGGTPGTEYKTASTVGNLLPGDRLVIPVKPTSNTGTYATSYNYYEVEVRATPTVACSTTGLLVVFGPSRYTRDTTVNTYPPHGTKITAADGLLVADARDDYDDTNVTIRNLRIEPQDPWNEYGGRCTSSGSAFRASATAVITPFSTATDDTNTDMSCDTLPLFGFWGGGHVYLYDVVVSNWHQYAFDAGGTGTMDAYNTRFQFGNGRAAADLSNGWKLHQTRVDSSTFIAEVFNIFGTGILLEDTVVTNSEFSNIVPLTGQADHAIITNLRNESNGFANTISVGCGAWGNIVKDVYQTGRGISSLGGQPAVIHLTCDDSTALTTQNIFENIVLDAPDASQGGATTPVVVFNPTSATETIDSKWSSIIGNIFKGVISNGYVGGTAGESSCLFGVVEKGSDSPANDDAESNIFAKNAFFESAVESNGRPFCIITGGTANPVPKAIASDAGTTPAWGDPVGCGIMDGAVPYPNSRCDMSELGNGTITVDLASVTAGTCSTIGTATLTGLATTDSIMTGFTGDPGTVAGRLIISGAASADTVTLRACNTSAAGLDPASATWWWKAVR